MTTAIQPLLSVQGLKTVFNLDEGVVRAVDGASFDVARGQTIAIVGESGCGKSVTARSILRLVDSPGRLIEGQILLQRDSDKDAKRVTDLAQLDPYGKEICLIRGKEIAMIFQEPMASFSPVHTVGNQIVEAITLHQGVGKREARQQAIEMLHKTGIPQPNLRIDSYAHQLSGGLLQRAMIAMALSCYPRILIADEPTTALDVTTQAQILVLLDQLQRHSDMAIIFITHDLGVVAEVADAVVVMYLGTVVEKGSVDQVFHSPKHPYTQALLRSVVPIQASRKSRLKSITGSIPHPLSRPPGCPFHNRCPERVAGKCGRCEPKLSSAEPNHEVACFLYPDSDNA